MIAMHAVLQAIHLVADVVADLDRLVLVLELATAAELEDLLALSIRALVLFTPLFMLRDLGKED
jgi:hypothetical protein